jgi:hypothetical protein
MPEAIYEAAFILAGINGADSISAYVFIAIRKNAENLTLSEEVEIVRDRRVCIGVLPPDVGEILDKKSTGMIKGKGIFAYACLRKEIYLEAKKWGCSSPEEFVQLMRSPNPIEIISRKLKRQDDNESNESIAA